MTYLVEGKRNGEAPKTTNVQKFLTIAICGFDNFAHIPAVGSYGEDPVACAKRSAGARGNASIADGVRFPIARRLLRADFEVDFGTVNTCKEADGSTTLGDGTYWSKVQLERYIMGGEKEDFPRSPIPTEMSEFADDTLQETRFAECFYRIGRGPRWKEATKFLEKPRRGNQEMHPVYFTVDTWRRMNVDFCDGMYGRIKRPSPLMPAACGRGN